MFLVAIAYHKFWLLITLLKEVKLTTTHVINIFYLHIWGNNVFFVSALKSVPLEIVEWLSPPPPPPHLKDPANFSASYKPRVDFPSLWESPEKIKNLNLIKLARNRNRAKRKCHTSFFTFHILVLKLVLSYSQLNSAPENQILFLLNSGCGTYKSSQTWRNALKIKIKNGLWHRKAQDRHMVEPNPLHIQDPKNRGSSIG